MWSLHPYPNMQHLICRLLFFLNSSITFFLCHNSACACVCVCVVESKNQLWPSITLWRDWVVSHPRVAPLYHTQSHRHMRIWTHTARHLGELGLHWSSSKWPISNFVRLLHSCCRFSFSLLFVWLRRYKQINWRARVDLFSVLDFLWFAYD